jgi:hypothetical protein
MNNELSVKTIEAFRTLIRSSKIIIGESKHIRLPIVVFSSFSEKARKIVVQQVRQAFEDPELIRRFKNLSRWLLLPPMDILERVGISELEDKYTRLITWMLFPPGRPDLALRIQRSWYASLRLPISGKIEQAAEPDEQHATKEGRPDIVLRYQRPQHTVIVEAKINSAEHETPKKIPQTFSYPATLREELKLPAEHEISMVFLTADNQLAENPDAISTSYEVLLNSIASELSPSEIPFDLRAAFSMIITHIFTHAALRSVEKANRLQSVAHFMSGGLSSLDDDKVLSEVGILGPFSRIIREGV